MPMVFDPAEPQKALNCSTTGRSYPPKYVVSLAVKNATGTELEPSAFIGGEPTNSTLRSLGFEVVAQEGQSIKDNLERVMAEYVSA
jgi:hypothetical protein